MNLACLACVYRRRLADILKSPDSLKINPTTDAPLLTPLPAAQGVVAVCAGKPLRPGNSGLFSGDQKSLPGLSPSK